MTARQRWLVLNQSQAPAFQQLLGELATRFGRCRVYTGMPHLPAPARLTLVRGPAYDRRSKLRRAASWVAFLVGAAVRALGSRRDTFLLAVTNPPFLPHVAWLASRVRGHRYAILVWDLYPDHVVRIGWLSERSLVVRAWRAANRLAFTGADVVVAIGPAMAEAIRRQLRAGDRCRIEIIPNWADVDAIRPRPKDQNPFAIAHRQVGKLTAMYSGNLGATHGASVIADVAEQCRADPRIAFVVVGDGLGRRELAAEIKRRSLANVTLLDPQPWDRLPQSLATADVSLVLQAPGTEHLSVPSKTYAALAAGSAILALTSAEGDLARLIRDHGAGFVAPMSDPASAARVLRDLANDPGRLAEMRAGARRAAERHFNPDVALQSFEAALRPSFERLAGAVTGKRHDA